MPEGRERYEQYQDLLKAGHYGQSKELAVSLDDVAIWHQALYDFAMARLSPSALARALYPSLGVRAIEHPALLSAYIQTVFGIVLRRLETLQTKPKYARHLGVRLSAAAVQADAENLLQLLSSGERFVSQDLRDRQRFGSESWTSQARYKTVDWRHSIGAQPAVEDFFDHRLIHSPKSRSQRLRRQLATMQEWLNNIYAIAEPAEGRQSHLFRTIQHLGLVAKASRRQVLGQLFGALLAARALPHDETPHTPG